MEFKPIKTRRIYEEIVNQIKELISQGELKPGDKLLSERELAEMLNVSRTSVREALSALELMGLVEIKPGEGTFIKKSQPSGIIEPLAMALLLEKEDIEDLFELRKILEGEAAALAAARAQKEELERIEKILAEMEEEIKNNKLAEESDLAFHYSIAEAAHNTFLFRLMATIADSLREVLSLAHRKFYSRGRIANLIQDHRSIVEAIAARDAPLARERMLKHLSQVEQNLKNNNK